jgi:hypothetical protein
MRAFHALEAPATDPVARGGGVVPRSAVAPRSAGLRAGQEQAADETAQAVMAAEPQLVSRRPDPVTAPRQTGGPLAAGGRPLDASERAFFEPRFGHDFSHVRVHSDERAGDLAALLHARAFTVGTEIFLGRQAADRRVLAHELAHVATPRPRLEIRRQAIPNELLTSPDTSKMSDEAIQRRHDWILEVLAEVGAATAQTTPEMTLLEAQAGRLGVELARRRALAAGRTFSEEHIEAARRYFVENAKTERDSCIVALNKGLHLVTGQPALPTTPKSIEASMKKVIASGMSTEAREIRFRTRSGNISRGGARPEVLEDSVWDAVLAMSGGDPGWSVFTMSLLDGDHSVTLTLDASDPATPKLFWSDQWKSKGGWKPYTRSTLDAEVTRLIKAWWDEQAVGKKFDPVVRLWRVRSTPGVSSGP